MVAILHTPQHAHHRREPTAVLQTDSRESLLVLQQTLPTDNIGLTIAILGLLQSLAARGKQVRLNWIPSHVDCQGKDAADAAAKAACRGPTVTKLVRPSLQRT